MKTARLRIQWNRAGPVLGIGILLAMKLALPAEAVPARELLAEAESDPPPNDPATLAPWGRKLLGYPSSPPLAGRFGLSAAADGPQPAEGGPHYHMPEVASDWFRIVEYPRHHLNDFCLFRDQQGIWHAIGIMGTGTWASETSLFHSTGHHLRGRFENHPPLFETMPRWIGERQSRNTAPQKHAPFVVFHDGLYHLFYRRPGGTILVVRSPDPFRWPDEAELVFEERDARDICITKIGGTFFMYYCQAAPVDGVMRSCVLMRTSKDLRDWSTATVACIDASRESRHSTLESPFVVPRPEGFYLFVRNRLLEEDTMTTVSFSKEPARFPGGRHPWFAELKHVHAPEIVEFDGRYYIARVSGPSHANRQAPAVGGWIEVAELRFR